MADVAGIPAATSGNAPAWVVYIIECRDGSYYTGITNDLTRRVAEHNAGTAARYTRSRRPVALRYHEPAADRAQALARECAVKLLTRREKDALIQRRG